MASLTAISSSARQLYILLQCINVTAKAEVKISSDGLRFSVEESRAIQALAFLNKSLFTSYNYSRPTFEPTEELDAPEQQESPSTQIPPFSISLAAVLETLRICGFADSARGGFSRDGSTFGTTLGDSVLRHGANAAFDNRVLGLQSTCRFTYTEVGEPLRITIEEGGVSTNCDLTTYEPEEYAEDIPFDREHLSFKVIMRASALYDAVHELSGMSPDKTSILCSPHAPFLSFSSEGMIGSTSVEFNRDSPILETFQVRRRTLNHYKFQSLRSAMKAMNVAAKVSIRCDEQGVLSLQFLIEVDNGGVSFIDFRFVPLLDEDGNENEAHDGESADNDSRNGEL